MPDIPFVPPFNAARLVNGNKPLSTRWYIKFWVWDAQKQKKIRKRDYKVNQFDTKNKRLAYANRVCTELNRLLKEGYHVNAVQSEKQAKVAIPVKREYTVNEAFDFVLQFVKGSKRPSTYNTYSSCASLFKGFCTGQGWEGKLITDLTKFDVLNYLDTVQRERTLNNCTRNAYLGHTKSLLTLMVDRGMIEKNPAIGIKQEPEDQGGNTAYLPEQVAILKEAINFESPRLWLFVSCLVYGFIRPAEIGRIKVKHVNLDKGEINLPGSITKNRKPRRVRISPPFKLALQALNLDQYKEDHFIFGHSLVTGPAPIQKNFASTLHTKIAREAGFPEEYTLYSWKHTGVIMHYKAGIDIKTLQEQLGHSSLQQMDVYLKSLGLYMNNEFEMKSPVI